MSTHWTCRQNCRAFRSACLPDDNRWYEPPLKAWANSGSTKSADPLGRRLWCFKTKLPCCASMRIGPYAHTCAAAVNVVVVESDGSRPDRPDYLYGGEQARRHLAACNRGHGLLRLSVEVNDGAGTFEAASPTIIADAECRAQTGHRPAGLSPALGAQSRSNVWRCDR